MATLYDKRSKEIIINADVCPDLPSTIASVLNLIYDTIHNYRIDCNRQSTDIHIIDPDLKLLKFWIDHVKSFNYPIAYINKQSIKRFYHHLHYKMLRMIKIISCDGYCCELDVLVLALSRSSKYISDLLDETNDIYEISLPFGNIEVSNYCNFLTNKSSKVLPTTHDISLCKLYYRVSIQYMGSPIIGKGGNGKSMVGSMSIAICKNGQYRYYSCLLSY